jgi:curli production assembly/transport component CsgG/holdfast attachment protein HfaB
VSIRGKTFFKTSLASVLAVLPLGGCVSPQPDGLGRYATPIGGAPVISNETPYSAALRCLSGYTSARPIRVAVGQIADYTGKIESDNSGRKLTQGAALMAMSALSKAGVRMVERFDTSVAEMELKYANNKLIGEDAKAGQPDFRKILAGSMPGSDYYIVGGITQLDFNIGSNNVGANAGETAAQGIKGTIGASLYVMSIAIDLRMVNTTTLEVVDNISYQKQLVARQLNAGVFDFLGQQFFDISAGASQQEPIQLGVRSVIERATLEMISRLYRTPDNACAAYNDPLADPYDRRGQTYPPLPQPAAYAQPPPGFQPQYQQAHQQPAPAYPQPRYQPSIQPAYVPKPLAKSPTEKTYEQARQDPYRWYGDRDPAAAINLRGRLSQ